MSRLRARLLRLEQAMPREQLRVVVVRTMPGRSVRFSEWQQAAEHGGLWAADRRVR